MRLVIILILKIVAEDSPLSSMTSSTICICLVLLYQVCFPFCQVSFASHQIAMPLLHFKEYFVLLLSIVVLRYPSMQICFPPLPACIITVCLQRQVWFSDQLQLKSSQYCVQIFGVSATWSYVLLLGCQKYNSNSLQCFEEFSELP